MRLSTYLDWLIVSVSTWLAGSQLVTAHHAQEKQREVCPQSLLRIKVANQYGYADGTGRVVIEPQYTNASPRFSEGLAYVQIRERFGYINHKGQIVIEPQFVTAQLFTEGLAAVMDSETNKLGYIDRLGHYRIPPRYAAAEAFRNGVARVATETLLGALRTSVADVGTQLQWKYICHTGEVLSVVCRDPSPSVCRSDTGKVGFCDHTDQLVIDATFDNALPFSEGRAAVLIKNSWGFIDGQGKMIVEPVFTAVRSFREGRAAVFHGGMWGYVDYNGQMVITPQFSMAWDFQDAVALVFKDQGQGWINPVGKFVLSFSE